MELNEKIRDILVEFHLICKQENWSEEQFRFRAIYDTFRIQNILEKENNDRTKIVSNT